MRQSPPIHADSDTRLRQAAGERGTGELDTLIRVEDERLTHPQRLIQTVQTKLRFQGVGEPLRQYLPAIPVQNRRQVHEPQAKPD